MKSPTHTEIANSYYLLPPIDGRCEIVAGPAEGSMAIGLIPDRLPKGRLFLNLRTLALYSVDSHEKGWTRRATFVIGALAEAPSHIPYRAEFADTLSLRTRIQDWLRAE